MRSERLYLLDLIEAIDLAERFLLGVDEEAFVANELVSAAVAQKFIIIGEAGRLLRDRLSDHYPDVAWNQAVSMRNLVVHNYFSVDRHIVYQTAKHDLPVLRAQMRNILVAEYPDAERSQSPESK